MYRVATKGVKSASSKGLVSGGAAVTGSSEHPSAFCPLAPSTGQDHTLDDFISPLTDAVDILTLALSLPALSTTEGSKGGRLMQELLEALVFVDPDDGKVYALDVH